MSARAEVTNGTDHVIDEEAVRLFTEEVLRRAASDGEVGVAFVDVPEMAALNETYRGMEGPTDVLSFSYESDDTEPWPEPEGGGEPDYLGDIVIAPDIAEENALEEGSTLALELRHLVVHGVLHLLGYDHELDEGRMLTLEHQILEQLAGAGPKLAAN